MEAFANFVQALFGGALALAGIVVMLSGAIGVLRFPDLYTRLHGAKLADGLGSSLVLVGLAILSDDGAMTVRLLLLAVLMAAAAPLLSHLAANAAHTGGLTPLAGRYTAPRPGARREAP